LKITFVDDYKELNAWMRMCEKVTTKEFSINFLGDLKEAAMK
jgi:hypothetical protein